MAGRAEPAAPVFDLSGGAPCLDFANTVSDRDKASPREHLRRYPDLLAWALQAGLVDSAAAAALRREAARRPRLAAGVLSRGLELREAIFAIFAGIAAGDTPSRADIEILNRHLERALQHLRVSVAPGGPRWCWRAEEAALDRVLWPVARSAAELLISGGRSRIRECAAGSCRWLFLDRSRNRSRRWCDMQVCGNRDKARRHYARKKRG